MDASSSADWLVACLCAAWCGSCRDYRATFEALARGRPDCRFVWVDIEDEADALAPFDLDIENFPTLLIAQRAAAASHEPLRFLGTVTPQAATLSQTLAAAQRAALVPTPLAQARGLIDCVDQIGHAVA